MKVFSDECKLVVEFFHIARVIDALLRCHAVLHRAVILACEVCCLAIASGVKALDAAVIYNHDHCAGEVVVVKKFCALPILEGCRW